MNKTIFNFRKMLPLFGMSAILFFGGCEKKPGPAGPQGNPGANVEAFTFSTTASDWFYDNKRSFYSTSRQHSSLNQQVFEKGAVQVFISDSTAWTALPWYYNIYQWYYSIENGKVNVYHSRGNGTSPENPGLKTFRVVVIPPAMMKPGVDYTDFSQLEKCYNLGE